MENTGAPGETEQGGDGGGLEVGEGEDGEAEQEAAAPHRQVQLGREEEGVPSEAGSSPGRSPVLPPE